MTAQHQDFADLAIEMIAEDGRPVVLVAYDSTGPIYKPERTEQPTGVMALQASHEMREAPSSLIRIDDKKFLIDAQVPIDDTMRIRDYGPQRDEMIPLGQWRAGIDPFGGVAEVKPLYDYSIVYVDTVQPGATPIMHKVYARV